MGIPRGRRQANSQQWIARPTTSLEVVCLTLMVMCAHVLTLFIYAGSRRTLPSLVVTQTMLSSVVHPPAPQVSPGTSPHMAAVIKTFSTLAPASQRLGVMLSPPKKPVTSSKILSSASAASATARRLYSPVYARSRTERFRCMALAHHTLANHSTPCLCGDP